MNIFDQLGKVYIELDNSLSIKESKARSLGHSRKEAEYQEKRKLNDQAYFLYMFTRLEDRINTRASTIIDSKISTTRNYNKRAWEILKAKNEGNRLTLADKTSLVIVVNGAEYHLIIRYKKQRDIIAHGGVASIINMPTALQDMKALYIHLGR